MQRLACIFFCLLPLVAMPSYAAPPSRVQAQYDVFKSGLKVAVMNETFVRHQNHYRIESVTKPYGLFALLKRETIRVTSEGSITAQGLQPRVFDYQRKEDTDKNAHADFDWQAAQVTLTDRNGTRSMPLPAGTQDRLSAMYQFMFLTLDNAAELKFEMTNGSKVDDYRYLITPNRQVTVPLGSFRTLYLASSLRSNGGRTEIWLAGKFSNLPCKMVITEGNGDKLTQTLTHLNFVP
jgi:Protein of unknown function (DUF3108)